MEKKVLGMEPNVAYGLTYLASILGFGFILAIIILCVDNENKVSKFVALQNIFLTIAEIVLAVTCIGWIVPLVFMIICCVKAFQGEATYKVWLVGDWAEKAAGN